MASITRPFAALRLRAPRTLATRYNSSSSTPPIEPILTSPKPATPSNEASSSSTPASSASESAADAVASESSEAVSELNAESSTPAAPPAVDENFDKSTPYTNSQYENSSTLSNSLPPGMTLFGPTSTYRPPSSNGKTTKESLEALTAEPDIPLSQKILTLHPIPKAPWLEKQPSIYTVNYPRPVFSTPNKEDIPLVLGGDRQERRMKVLGAITGMTAGELRGLRRCTVESRYVVNMTKKGKMRSVLAYVVVGDPKKGLVGLGRGRGKAPAKAVEAAFYNAVMQMDAVNRYEGRTLWGQGKELQSKFASTKVSLRARPPGHGLQVPHSVHRILSACGIKDASADINGSTHVVNVMKAVIQLLHGGANPPGFGDGVGGQAKRENKGHGMRSKEEIERSRGRYGVDVGLNV